MDLDLAECEIQSSVRPHVPDDGYSFPHVLRWVSTSLTGGPESDFAPKLIKYSVSQPAYRLCSVSSSSPLGLTYFYKVSRGLENCSESDRVEKEYDCFWDRGLGISIAIKMWMVISHY
jgi:hypothetical protein